MIKPGDIVMFVKEHSEQPGIDYVKDWLGIVVGEVMGSEGEIEELHILWNHGKVSEYLSSWWNKLAYFPFENVNENN